MKVGRSCFFLFQHSHIWRRLKSCHINSLILNWYLLIMIVHCNTNIWYKSKFGQPINKDDLALLICSSYFHLLNRKISIRQFVNEASKEFFFDFGEIIIRPFGHFELIDFVKCYCRFVIWILNEMKAKLSHLKPWHTRHYRFIWLYCVIKRMCRIYHIISFKLMDTDWIKCIFLKERKNKNNTSNNARTPLE